VRIGSAASVSILLAVASSVPVGAIAAQTADSTLANASRQMVTRAEIQAALNEIDQGVAASTGYSAALRGRKHATADMLRERLTMGDLRTGDQIKIEVLSAPTLNGTYDVSSRQTIILTGGVEISVHGVLRSETQAYLTTKLKDYVKDPVVTATPLVRIQIFGAVGKPGFFNVPADQLLTRVITDPGGGPLNNANLKKSEIRRNGRVVVDGAEFQDAIYRARTLDQLNIQAGDEIFVATKPPSAFILRAVGVLSGLSGLVYLLVRVL